jgi:hypothetical protein
VIKVGYLSDIFSEVNDLNISMQGHDQTMVTLSEKVTLLKKRLKLWTEKVKEGKTTSLSTLNLLLEDDHSTFISVQDIIVKHLENLTSEFNHYVPDNVSKYTWVQNTFTVNTEDLPEDTANIPKLQDLLTEIQIGVIWIQVKQDTEIIGREAIKVILPLETTRVRLNFQHLLQQR